MAANLVTRTPNLLTSTRSGHLLTIRPVRTADGGRICHFLEAVSARSRWLRYRSTGSEDLPRAEAERLTRASPDHLLVLLALAAAPGNRGRSTLAGVGEMAWNTAGPGVAEMGLLVADRFQGDRIGTVLATQLVAAARRRSMTRLRIEVAAENDTVLHMLRRSAAVWSADVRHGEIALLVDL